VAAAALAHGGAPKIRNCLAPSKIIGQMVKANFMLRAEI